MDKIKAIYFENNPTHYQAKFLANILWRMQWNEKKKGYEIILSPDEALTMSGRKHAPDDMDIEKFCYNMLSPALVVEYEENNKDDNFLYFTVLSGATQDEITKKITFHVNGTIIPYLDEIKKHITVSYKFNLPNLTNPRR